MRVAIRAEIHLSNGTINHRAVAFEIKSRELAQLSTIRDTICEELRSELPDGAIKDIKVFWAPFTGGKVRYREIKSNRKIEV